MKRRDHYLILENKNDNSYLQDWSEYDKIVTFNPLHAYLFKAANPVAVDTAKALADKYKNYNLKRIAITIEEIPTVE